MAFMPEYAPFVFLGLLGTGFFLAVATLAIIVTFVLGKRRLARWPAKEFGEENFFAEWRM